MGNDLGGLAFNGDESVTLTAYDALGNFIGQAFSNVNLPAGLLDQTPASIAFPNMRYVAFNYTDTMFGFYTIDDLTFTPAGTGVPEPSTLLLVATGLFGLSDLVRRRLRK